MNTDRIRGLLLGASLGGRGVVLIHLPLTQSFSLTFSIGVRGPASRGRITTVKAPPEEGEEQRDVRRKGWRKESVLS